MAETREVLESQLQQYQNDRQVHEKALVETRSLLERADLRRKQDRSEQKRWDDTLDNLEDSLADIKRKLTVSENNIRTIGRKIEAWDKGEPLESIMVSLEIDELSAEIQPAPERSEKMQVMEAVIKRVVNSPIFMVTKLAEEDINIAKALIESAAGKNLPADSVDEIKKRISIYERSKEKQISSRTNKKVPDDVDVQPILREALDKCIKLRYSQLTLQELEAIRKYYEHVLTIDSLSHDDQKRLTILKKSIGNINEILRKFPKA